MEFLGKMELYIQGCPFTVTKMTLKSIEDLNISIKKDGRTIGTRINSKDNGKEFYNELLKGGILSTIDEFICKQLIEDNCERLDDNIEVIVDNYQNLYNLFNFNFEFELQLIYGNEEEGKFSIDSIIGVGNNTIIYKLKHSNDKYITLKMSNIDINAFERKLIKNEIDILDKLKKCNYVTKLIGNINLYENIFIFTEYFENSTTLNKLSSSDDLFFYGKLIKNLIDGLNSIHSFNISHRDIKNENILFNGNGDIKYIDFDLSCNSRDLSRVKITDGTREYIDPILFIKNEFTFDDLKKADYWSLGVVIFKLFNNKFPRFDLYAKGVSNVIKLYINDFDKIIFVFKDLTNDKINKINLANEINFNLFDLINIKSDERILQY